jgi:3-isopropylmalate/(R)-2-methylmalate dehydratase small subunit
MEQTNFTGKIWVLSGLDGQLIKDIDTDQIYHNAFLHITELATMGKYAFGNLEGWKDFPENAQPGDMIITGRNFGAGSFRNAVNSGFPVLKSHTVEQLVLKGNLETGDRISVDVLSGECTNVTKDLSFDVLPMSKVQHDVFQAGGLFRYGKEWR